MKTLLLSVVSVLALSFGYSQEKTCYQQYYEVFKVRGADNVADGEHENVIFTERSKDGASADCFYGKAIVKDGAVIECHIQFEDGTYEPYIIKRESKFPITIQGGITRTVVLKDEGIFNVMFVNHILPPKKKYKRAAPPKIGLK